MSSNEAGRIITIGSETFSASATKLYSLARWEIGEGSIATPAVPDPQPTAEPAYAPIVVIHCVTNSVHHIPFGRETSHHDTGFRRCILFEPITAKYFERRYGMLIGSSDAIV